MAVSSPSFAADEDGCWSGFRSGSPCLKWSVSRRGGDIPKTYINLSNRCTDRLYVKWCVRDLKAGRWNCGASGLKGGQSFKKYEFATGGVEVRFIGSRKWSKDWTCSSKASNWDID